VHLEERTLALLEGLRERRRLPGGDEGLHRDRDEREPAQVVLPGELSVRYGQQTVTAPVGVTDPDLTPPAGAHWPGLVEMPA
jgi:hypothetical protein